MEKHTKQLLGCLGLAAVATMTGVAIALPGPEASAVGASASVNYQVTVQQPASGEIVSPEDGTALTRTPVTVTLNYSHSSFFTYVLKYQGTVVKTDTVTLPDESGTYNLALGGLDEFGDYTLAVRFNNVASTEDTVSFRFSASNPVNSGTNKDGDPILSTETNPRTETIKVQIYDPNGNPLLNPPREVTVDHSKNPQEIIPPFSELGLDSGTYKVELSSYDRGGNLLDVVTIIIKYTAPGQPPVPDTGEVPGVPNTGALKIGDLTISRLDYLLTGVVVFALVAGGACYLLHKKKSSRK